MLGACWSYSHTLAVRLVQRRGVACQAEATALVGQTLTIASAYANYLDRVASELRGTAAFPLPLRSMHICDVVREHTGCELRILPGSGEIDHQSAMGEKAVGLELFDSAETFDLYPHIVQRHALGEQGEAGGIARNLRSLIR